MSGHTTSYRPKRPAAALGRRSIRFPYFRPTNTERRRDKVKPKITPRAPPFVASSSPAVSTTMAIHEEEDNSRSQLPCPPYNDMHDENDSQPSVTIPCPVHHYGHYTSNYTYDSSPNKPGQQQEEEEGCDGQNTREYKCCSGRFASIAVYR